MTIPKLELSAAELLTKLFKKVIAAFDNSISYRCQAWSEPTIALAWIRNNSTKLNVFVANRVSRIKAANLLWRYVPTDLNPADCASRGATPHELLNHS